jgi:choline kinase
MQADLLLDIEQVEPQLKDGQKMDSLCEKVINNEFTNKTSIVVTLLTSQELMSRLNFTQFVMKNMSDHIYPINGFISNKKNCSIEQFFF